MNYKKGTHSHWISGLFDIGGFVFLNDNALYTFTPVCFPDG